LSQLVRVGEVDGRVRYQLLTSLVVPRPIGWVSTRSVDGTPNLAPFSFFGAISATPMLLNLSIGTRNGVAKDSLKNIRERGEFCVNVVTETQLEAMNVTAGDYAPDVDEFARAGLPVAEAETVDAPFVGNCPAVFECRLFREVELAPGVVLVIAEAMGIRLDESLPMIEGTRFVETRSLRPVGRLGAAEYGLLGEIRTVERPG
jgi:flavin reductase (DIM6/NTAB) family NADH-FMN oxidoreductase RutF